MNVSDALLWVVSLVMVASGAMKLTDPRATTETLAGIGLPSPRAAGRLTGVAEVAVGLAVLVFGTRPLALVLAVLYLAFAGVVVLARRAGLASCGCFGSRSSEPNLGLVAVDLASAAVGVVAALSGAGPRAVSDGLDTLTTGAAVAVVVAVVAGAVAVIALDTRSA